MAASQIEDQAAAKAGRRAEAQTKQVNQQGDQGRRLADKPQGRRQPEPAAGRMMAQVAIIKATGRPGRLPAV